ncbi:MAG: LicD family protein [Bacteroides sp.]|nr:LicD family protein [Bacteroides sp.]MCM1446697.1 LicD family protein [Bacteroides sp.]
MKSDMQIMNELAVASGFLKPLSEEESKGQKLLLLEMYKDIASLCDKHNLVYMMGGGTCLGTIRHQGYIPWDDDLDLMIPRTSYEKLIALCKAGELGEKYEIDAPSKDKDCKNPYLKIYRKNTLDAEIYCEDTPFPVGVFIDIFPMDNAPKNKYARKLKGFMSDFLQAICTCVLYAQYPSQKYKEFMSLDSEALKRYKQRMFIGKVFGIIPHRKWVWWFDMFNARTKETGLITIPTGRKHYFGETQPISVFLPTQKAMFEGIEVNVPADYDTYLTALYRDYMSIPPVEKRERHFVYKFSLNTENE